MVFSSLTFILFFLPITLITYKLTPKKFKNITLLISSLVFYSWGEPIYIILMIFSSVVDYTHGLLINRFAKKDTKKKLVLLSSIIINLGLLGYFKYSNFIINNLNYIFNFNINNRVLTLPIGISFYTFQTMSYTIDVYRGKVKAQKSLLNFATYVTLFPQLIAGPIVRYKTVAKELKSREENTCKFSYGVKRFIIGLSKKIILANNIGIIWNNILQQGISNLTKFTAILGLVAFSMQIYFDFSGYSDMAIGLGKMFGFNFLENFNYPYISKSISEFWRRWHISLGEWFKDYVYISLGGSKVSKAKTTFNILTVWILTGLWHGASWNFIIWGLYFGVLIILEKLFLQKLLQKFPPIIQHLYTLLLVMISWVLFNFTAIEDIITYLSKVLYAPFFNDYFLYMINNNFVILSIGAISATPIPCKLIKRFKKSRIKQVLGNATLLTLLLISLAYLVDSSFNPFLYFRF